MSEFAVEVSSVTHSYGKLEALKGVNLQIRRGSSTGIVGADGTGKSTLLSLIAGVKILQTGSILTLGRDISKESSRYQLSHAVAIMPQGLGKNLYPTLTVLENLEFHARLFGLDRRQREKRMKLLLAATSLSPFAGRAAGKLSGGMKQKLSLCCALVHSPDLLILDEPTTGVDPLSRRQFWDLLAVMRNEDPDMTLMVSTAYIDEAEGFENTVIMDDGCILAHSPTKELIAAGKSRDLEEAYLKALPEHKRGKAGGFVIPPFEPEEGEPPVIEANELTKVFGNFTAVDHVSFRISRGEIFGFLGSNGCGKSTTMKMLTGLLEPSSGTAAIMGRPIDSRDIAARMRVGYMSQAFSLYEELSVRANLRLHAQLYRIPRDQQSRIIRETMERFELTAVAREFPSVLSLGVRQRLQLAAACLHRPEILILDEPTSGVDPAARDMFWDYLIKLSREERVTIFVSTHFMNEAARCDRISLMHRGRVLAVGSPEELKRSRKQDTLEKAFIGYLEDQMTEGDRISAQEMSAVKDDKKDKKKKDFVPGGFFYSFFIIYTFALREMRELLRDPIRIFFALFGAVVLVVTAVHGISFDLAPLPFMAVDQDNSPESRRFISEFAGSPYLIQKEIPAGANQDPETLLREQNVRLVVEIPPGFGSDLLKGRKPEAQFHIDAVFPSISNNIVTYATGITGQYLKHEADRSSRPGELVPGYGIETRMRYNEAFESVYVITPGLIMVALVLFPGMMTALGVVREKERGTISNLSTSPARVYQYLIGKQIPYIIVAFACFLQLCALAVFFLDVPVRGSFAALCLGAFLAITASSSFGLLVSCFVRSQIAAVFGTAVLSIVPSINFSGFMFPASSLELSQQIISKTFPGCWFQLISLGTFTKGLGFGSFLHAYGALVLLIVSYLTLATLLLRKQEK
jgi:ribosome-dependent ATPase